MRLLDERARNDRAVLEHIFQIDQIAVVHMLGKIITVVEVDDALFVRPHDVGRQQNTVGDVLGHLPRHIVALHAVHRGIFIGILLLYLFVVAFDETENTVIRRIGLSRERAGIAIGDIFARERKFPVRHDFVFHEVLDLFHVERANHAQSFFGHDIRDLFDFLFAEFIPLKNLVIRLPDRIDNLIFVEYRFLSVSLYNLHNGSFPSVKTSLNPLSSASREQF